MAVVLILVVVALVLAPRALRKRPRALLVVRLILCCTALTLAALHHQQRRRSPRILRAAELSFDRHWMVGFTLGTQLSNDVPEGGLIVVLQSSNPSHSWSTMIESEMDGLRAALELDMFALERYRPDILPPGTPRQDEDPEPLSLEECLALAAEADAVVSFIQIPLTNAPTLLPPVYLLDDQGFGYWKTSMEAGLVRAVITPRMQVGRATNTEPNAPEPESFDAIYQVITASNIDEFRTPIEQFREAQQATPSP
jgi:hypothetical protein